MQQTPKINGFGRRVLSGVGLLCTLFTLFSPAAYSSLAPKEKTIATKEVCLQPKLLLALASTPKFLCIEPAPQVDAVEKEEVITAFFGDNQALAEQPTPERPAITSSDEVSLERPEFTAGVHVNMGSVKFNLGYTLPASQVDSFVRPLGVELDPGTDIKRFSLGVAIPF